MELLDFIRKPLLISEARSRISSSQIPILSEPIDYKNFFLDFLATNRPCVFGDWLTRDWTCRREWVSNSRINIPALRTAFGDAFVPVANCKSRRYDAQVKSEWKFDEYLNYFQTFEPRTTSEILYCKDWHLLKQNPHYIPYETPVFFQSDWLNEYWDVLGFDDYRFCYMGPESSWTPFHADVLRSYSWSSNVCGSKLWLLFAAGDEEDLREKSKNLPFDISDLIDKNRKLYSITQTDGQTIFVPSGWHHQVHNAAATISVNHNWLNGCNVDLGFRHLQKCRDEVEKAISDCRDMEGFEQQCQIILKANEGMDFNDFAKFLMIIAEIRRSRIACRDSTTSLEMEIDSFRPESWLHDVFDLSRVLNVIHLMKTDKDCQLVIDKFHELESLERDIVEIIDKC